MKTPIIGRAKESSPPLGVAVGDISEVAVDAWGSGDTTGGDDGGGAGRERGTGLVGTLYGHWRVERDAGIQQGGDRVGIGDGTRGWFWGCSAHGDCAVRTDGMRGDRVGVGDIGAMHGAARGSGDETICVDSWRSIW